MRHFIVTLAALLALAIPASAVAQDSPDAETDGFAFQVGSDYELAEGDRVETAIIINADADVAGDVEDALIVINGDARVDGTVGDDVVIINGTVTLGSESRTHDIELVNSDLEEQPGAEVTGQIDRDASGIPWSAATVFLFGFGFWVAITIAVIAAGLVFAAVAGGQLGTATRLMGEAAGQSILSGLIAMIGLPILAVLVMITVIGIPIGLGVLLVVLPVLVFLGYLVAGTWLGTLILHRGPEKPTPPRPFAAATLGLLIFQVLLLVPGIAPLIVLIAGVWGAGVLVYIAWRNIRGGNTGGQAPASASVSAPGTE